MTPFTIVRGRAAPMPAPNVDTDIIMPKTFLKGIDRAGLAQGAFNLLRFKDGKPNPDFVLNRPGYASACFLVVGPNFGCGSSREHAVWGLQQLGVRALIGTSFAGIFDDNCFNNGILTVTLDADRVQRVMSLISDPGYNTLEIDLCTETLTLEATGEQIPFAVEPLRRAALLEGLDAIAQTLVFKPDIESFEIRYRSQYPWIS